ncbi:MAG: GntR family transcriptional regulator [Coprobacter sp.]|uniref:GntR family transcriptional regulator n=1 Tax=Barnesiella propionica TaxID=2981781 RepID=UPI000D78FD4D|nr:GntR family transcriptional regulator [Barnesiella propionica]MBO1735403.1 GntR family transcriptional regulator [Barnesiella sp. GGCC_0306]MBS7038960.1 GntR family transcriptional regulator [Bacteroidales bacterium]MCU6769634.1 GntR family transcriptional regulator [Barnesiella propionica]PWM90181.1 MAG: GntR family transcriptional regulator [Coprobacter sp.]
MKFKENQTIYLQISERICDEILLGKYLEESRIPSVREYAALVEVNANTVMRSYEFLQQQDIIYNKRGIGFFVSPGSKEQIIKFRRHEFMKNELERFFMQLYTLDISMEEIEKLYRQFTEKLPTSKYKQS